MTKQAYIIIADEEVDQVCETKVDAMRERKDLKAMGCSVSLLTVDWAAQDRAIELFEQGHRTRAIEQMVKRND